MMIKIVRRPVGEAPDWVRDAWVGLSIPLALPGLRRSLGLGVLSGPKNRVLRLWALVRGKGQSLTGYIVNAKEAVDRLQSVRPDAAEWWRQNAPALLDGKRCFVFDAAACEQE